jgi:hypothetical protein
MKPIDDGPHGGKRPVAGHIVGVTSDGRAVVSMRAPTNPVCSPCSRAWQARHKLPGHVPVERAIVIRDLPRARYVAVVHCHGASEVVELGEAPSETSVASVVAFRGERR